MKQRGEQQVAITLRRPGPREPNVGPATDDGCDSTPNLFQAIAPAAYPATVSIRGSSRAIGGNRDTDWYRFQAPATDALVLTINANAQVVMEALQEVELVFREPGM